MSKTCDVMNRRGRGAFFMKQLLFMALQLVLWFTPGAEPTKEVKEDLQPMITLNNGLKLEGKSTIEGQSFRGIRYGQPPIGSLRWAPPSMNQLKLISESLTMLLNCEAFVRNPFMCTRQGCSEVLILKCIQRSECV